MTSPCHVSFDIETLSTRPDAHILSIGAAVYLKGELVTFHAYVHPTQTERHICPQTVTWWQGQDSALREQTEQLCQQAPTLRMALDHLTAWYQQCITASEGLPLYAWGNGSSFDIAILEHAYKTYDLTPPWEFYLVRDLRTLKHLAQVLLPTLPRVERQGNHHDGKDDAVYQLQLIHAYWSAINEVTHHASTPSEHSREGEA